MSKTTGGPAFPCGTTNGMSLRDYFASSAMAGYVMGWPLQTDAPIENLPVIAKMSYKIADAMLEQRLKT